MGHHWAGTIRILLLQSFLQLPQWPLCGVRPVSRREGVNTASFRRWCSRLAGAEEVRAGIATIAPAFLDLGTLGRGMAPERIGWGLRAVFDRVWRAGSSSSRSRCRPRKRSALGG
jgi:hypothetical protein